MGYQTDFFGAFNLNKPLTPEHKAYLEAFAGTRRMKRDGVQTILLPDARREAVGLPVGREGCYYVGAIDAAQGFMGQIDSLDVIEHNYPPEGQPGLWCKWVPNEDGTAIEWNGVEKFYDYIEWIKYLIVNFLKPWGYVLNGRVDWRGEEQGDKGVIDIYNNTVRVRN